MSSYSGHIRLLVILVLFLALLTIASIILSVVSITSWGRKDDAGDYDHYKNYYYSNYGKDNKDAKTPYHPYPPHPYPPRENYRQSPVVITNRISDYTTKNKDCYTIAFGTDWYQHEFIDENDKCAHKGWGPAIVLAACEAAGIKCKIVYAPYSDCLDYFTKDDYEKHPILGDGLYYHAIDACGGWFPDQERYNVAAFTDGWVRRPNTYLFYESSGVPSGTINIGFSYASSRNEKCLRRYLTRLSYSYNQLVPYSGEGSLYTALQNGDVQLAFLSDLTADVPGGFTGLSRLFPNDPMICSLGDGALVTRKCEWEFIQKFNKGLTLIKHNGVLREICNSVIINSPDRDGQWCPETVWA